MAARMPDVADFVYRAFCEALESNSLSTPAASRDEEEAALPSTTSWNQSGGEVYKDTSFRKGPWEQLAAVH